MMRPLCLLALLLISCAPMINVRRVAPAQVRFGANVHTLSVGTQQSGLIAQIFLKDVRRKDQLARLAADRVEQGLVGNRVWGVIGNCSLPCMSSDATLEVSISDVNFRNVELDKKGKVSTTARADVTVFLQAMRPSGEIFWQRSYGAARQSGSDDTSPDRGVLVDGATVDAADQFLQATLDHEVDDWFRLRKVDALEAGNELLAKGDIDGALTAYRAVLAGQPQNADALYSVGVALLARGDLQGARDAFVQATQLNDRFTFAVENIDARLNEAAVLAGPR